MKINDIIFEDTSSKMTPQAMQDELNKLESENKLEDFGLDTKDIPKIVQRAQVIQNTSTDAYQGITAVTKAINDLSREKAARKQKQKSQTQPKTSSTPADQRGRKDTMGRNLQHDRYYRDKDDGKKSKEIDLDSPTMFDLPDNHFDFIPGVKTVKKAAKVGKSAGTKFRRAYNRASSLQNFSDKSRKKR